LLNLEPYLEMFTNQLGTKNILLLFAAVFHEQYQSRLLAGPEAIKGSLAYALGPLWRPIDLPSVLVPKEVNAGLVRECKIDVLLDNTVFRGDTVAGFDFGFGLGRCDEKQ